VEHGPLPPHERHWRHPSELAAEERELARAQPVRGRARIVALTTGSAGLAAIAVLFLTVTPTRHAQPVAVSATTDPSAAVADDESRAAATIVAARRTAPERSAAGSADEASPLALATPIGAGQYAVVLRAAVASTADGLLEVILPSGRRTSGSVVDTDGGDSTDAVLVHLDDHEPGHNVADGRPHERDIVTVMATPPITVALADLDQIDVADGTAVIDAEGQLVGLCSEGARGVRLVEVPAGVAAGARP
jgi:hypothetical protein